LGVSRKQSSRWQKLAGVADDAFESYLDTAKADDKAEITAIGLTQ
jgi:hypothetical protein